MPWNADREMISQGMANLASGIAGAFPVGGSFSRSTLSRSAGATSAWAGAVTGALVLAALPLAPLLEDLPLAVLGAIVIVVVVRLVDLRTLMHLSRSSFPQAVVGIGTLTATLAMAPRVERGVLIGLGLSIAVHLYRELNVTFATERDGNKLTVRPHGVLWFATVPFVERLIREEIARHRRIDTVVIDLGGVGRLDYSGAAGLSRVLSERVAPHSSGERHRNADERFTCSESRTERLRSVHMTGQLMHMTDSIPERRGAGMPPPIRGDPPYSRMPRISVACPAVNLLLLFGAGCSVGVFCGCEVCHSARHNMHCTACCWRQG